MLVSIGAGGRPLRRSQQPASCGGTQWASKQIPSPTHSHAGTGACRPPSPLLCAPPLFSSVLLFPHQLLHAKAPTVFHRSHHAELGAKNKLHGLRWGRRQRRSHTRPGQRQWRAARLAGLACRFSLPHPVQVTAPPRDALARC